MNSSIIKNDRYFFLGAGIWFTLITFYGFSETFYLKRDPEILMNLIVHGLVFTGWVILFLVQTTLISNKKVKTHMALGFISIALVVAMIPSGYFTVLYKVLTGKKGFDEGGYNIFTLTVGYCFILLGIVFRKTPFYHKRFMLFAMIILTIAATDRVAYLLELDHSQLFRKGMVFFPAIALFIFDFVKSKSLVWFNLLPILTVLLLFFFSDYFWLSSVGDRFMHFLLSLI